MSRARPSSVALLLLAALSATPSVDGQQVVTAGSIVRLSLGEGAAPIEGVVSSLTADAWAVTLTGGEVRRVSPGDVSALEVQVVRRNTLRGALIGGGVGLVGGLLVVATSDDNCDQAAFSAACDELAGIANNLLLLWTPLVGAAAGALVGTLVTSTRWVPAVAPSGPGAVDLVWSLSAVR